MGYCKNVQVSVRSGIKILKLEQNFNMKLFWFVLLFTVHTKSVYNQTTPELIENEYPSADVCNATWFNESFIQTETRPNVTLLTRMRKECTKVFPHCKRIVPTVHLSMLGKSRGYFAVSVYNMHRAHTGCWGLYLDIFTEANELLLRRYYDYNNQIDNNGHGKHDLNFTDDLLNKTINMRLTQVPNAQIKLVTVPLPKTKCQRFVRYETSSFYWDNFDTAQCQYYHSDSNLQEVAEHFCESHGNPVDEIFIQQRLLANLVIHNVTCDIEYVEKPLVKEVASKCQNESECCRKDGGRSSDGYDVGSGLVHAAALCGVAIASLLLGIVFAMKKDKITRFLRLNRVLRRNNNSSNNNIVTTDSRNKHVKSFTNQVFSPYS